MNGELAVHDRAGGAPGDPFARSPRSSWIARCAAACIVLVLAADGILRATGLLVLCKQCGQSKTHGPLVIAGLIAWSGFVVLAKRLPARWCALWLGAAAGVHLALATVLVAIPRWCTTCAVVCALACLAAGSAVARPELARWTLLAGLVALIATHGLIAIAG